LKYIRHALEILPMEGNYGATRLPGWQTLAIFFRNLVAQNRNSLKIKGVVSKNFRFSAAPMRNLLRNKFGLVKQGGSQVSHLHQKSEVFCAFYAPKRGKNVPRRPRLRTSNFEP
jgi:hypothetical protein